MFDQENFIMDFLAINWDDILKTNECNTDLSTDIFYSKINELLDKYVPVTKLNKKQIKNISKPWITSGIQKSICIRNQLHKKCIKEKNPRTKTLIENQYKKYRNLITKLYRQSKKNYFSLFFQKNSKSIRKMWEGINSIISLKNTKSKIPSSIFVNNKISSDIYLILLLMNSIAIFLRLLNPFIKKAHMHQNLSKAFYQIQMTNQCLSTLLMKKKLYVASHP